MTRSPRRGVAAAAGGLLVLASATTAAAAFLDSASGAPISVTVGSVDITAAEAVGFADGISVSPGQVVSFGARVINTGSLPVVVTAALEPGVGSPLSAAVSTSLVAWSTGASTCDDVPTGASLDALALHQSDAICVRGELRLGDDVDPSLAGEVAPFGVRIVAAEAGGNLSDVESLTGSVTAVIAPDETLESPEGEEDPTAEPSLQVVPPSEDDGTASQAEIPGTDDGETPEPGEGGAPAEPDSDGSAGEPEDEPTDTGDPASTDDATTPTGTTITEGER